jgi:hypothetical protein
MMLPRVGEHTGQAAYALVIFTPDFARTSIFGVS